MKNFKISILNFYYYLFYVMVKVIKWLNPRRLAPNFAGMLLVSAVFFFNIVALIIAVAGDFLTRSNVKIINITLMLLIISVNYFLLISKGKGEAIIDFYDRRFMNESHGKWRVLLVVLYISLTVIIAIYAATVSRSNIQDGLNNTSMPQVIFPSPSGP